MLCMFYHSKKKKSLSEITWLHNLTPAFFLGLISPWPSPPNHRGQMEKLLSNLTMVLAGSLAPEVQLSCWSEMNPPAFNQCEQPFLTGSMPWASPDSSSTAAGLLPTRYPRPECPTCQGPTAWQRRWCTERWRVEQASGCSLEWHHPFFLPRLLPSSLFILSGSQLGKHNQRASCDSPRTWKTVKNLG